MNGMKYWPSLDRVKELPNTCTYKNNKKMVNNLPNINTPDALVVIIYFCTVSFSRYNSEHPEYGINRNINQGHYCSSMERAVILGIWCEQILSHFVGELRVGCGMYGIDSVCELCYCVTCLPWHWLLRLWSVWIGSLTNWCFYGLLLFYWNLSRNVKRDMVIESTANQQYLTGSNRHNYLLSVADQVRWCE